MIVNTTIMSSLGKDSTSNSSSTLVSSSSTVDSSRNTAGSSQSGIASSSLSISPSSDCCNNNNNGDGAIVTMTRKGVPNDKGSNLKPSKSPTMKQPPPPSTLQKTSKNNNENRLNHPSTTNSRTKGIKFASTKSSITEATKEGTQETNVPKRGDIPDHYPSSSGSVSSSSSHTSYSSSSSSSDLLDNLRNGEKKRAGAKHNRLAVRADVDKDTMTMMDANSTRMGVLNHRPSHHPRQNRSHNRNLSEYNEEHSYGHCDTDQKQRVLSSASVVVSNNRLATPITRHPGQFLDYSQPQRFGKMDDPNPNTDRFNYSSLNHRFGSFDSSGLAGSSQARTNTGRLGPSTLHQNNQPHILDSYNTLSLSPFDPNSAESEWVNEDRSRYMSRASREYDTTMSSYNGGPVPDGVANGAPLSSSDSMLLSTIRRRRLLQLRQMVYYRKAMMSTTSSATSASYVLASSQSRFGYGPFRGGARDGGFGCGIERIYHQTNPDQTNLLDQQQQQQQLERLFEYRQHPGAPQCWVSDHRHNPSVGDMNDADNNLGTTMAGKNYTLPIGTTFRCATTAIKDGIDPLLGFLPSRDTRNITGIDSPVDGFTAPFHNKYEYDRDYATAMEVVHEIEENQNCQWHPSSFSLRSNCSTSYPPISLTVSSTHPGSNSLDHGATSIGRKNRFFSRSPSLVPGSTIIKHNPVVPSQSTTHQLLPTDAGTQNDRFNTGISAPPPSPVKKTSQVEEEKPSDQKQTSPSRLLCTTATKAPTKDKKTTKWDPKTKTSSKPSTVLKPQNVLKSTVPQCVSGSKQEDISTTGEKASTQMGRKENDVQNLTTPTMQKETNSKPRRRQKERHRPTFRELRQVSMLETQEQLRLARSQLDDYQRHKLESLLLVDPNDTEEAVKHIIIPPVLWSDIRSNASTNRIRIKPDNSLSPTPSPSEPQTCAKISPVAVTESLSLKDSFSTSLTISSSTKVKRNETVLLDNRTMMKVTGQSKMDGVERLSKVAFKKLDPATVIASSNRKIATNEDTKSSCSSAVVVPLSPPSRRPEIATSTTDFLITDGSSFTSNKMDLEVTDIDHSQQLTDEPELVLLLSSNETATEVNNNGSIPAVDQSKPPPTSTAQATPANRHCGSIVVTPVSCTTTTESSPKHQFQPIGHTETYVSKDTSNDSSNSKRNSDDVEVESSDKIENMDGNEHRDNSHFDNLWGRSPKRCKTMEPNKLFCSPAQLNRKVTIVAPATSSSMAIPEDRGHLPKYIDNFEEATYSKIPLSNRTSCFGKVQQTSPSMFDDRDFRTNNPYASSIPSDMVARKYPRRHSFVVKNLFGKNKSTESIDSHDQIDDQESDIGEDNNNTEDSSQKLPPVIETLTTNQTNGLNMHRESHAGPTELTRNISEPSHQTQSPTFAETNTKEYPTKKESIGGSIVDAELKRSDLSTSVLGSPKESCPEQSEIVNKHVGNFHSKVVDV